MTRIDPPHTYQAQLLLLQKHKMAPFSLRTEEMLVCILWYELRHIHSSRTEESSFLCCAKRYEGGSLK